MPTIKQCKARPTMKGCSGTVKTRFGKFKIGEKVFYDVFPLGRNMTGIITKKGVRTTGKFAKEFDKTGISLDALFKDIYDLRKR